jgi:cell division protein FtsB
MSDIGNWSSDSQAHTRICVLESQVDVKDNRIGTLKAENLVLKSEIERLQELIKTLVEGAE